MTTYLVIAGIIFMSSNDSLFDKIIASIIAGTVVSAIGKIFAKVVDKYFPTPNQTKVIVEKEKVPPSNTDIEIE